MKFDEINAVKAKYNPRAKARYVSTILYPESMRADWEEVIGDELQIPYCYVIHDKDSDAAGNLRKKHVHLIMVFSNTTTLKHALDVANRLRGSAAPCAPTIEPVVSIRSAYEYLIHNTTGSKNKHQYDPKERISGNGFDVGSYEVLSEADKDRITDELIFLILEYGFTNYLDFIIYVMSNFDDEHKKIAKSQVALFRACTQGAWHKLVTAELKQEKGD